jgi:hypothetical protein
MSGKKYNEVKALVTKEAYEIDEAIELLKKTSVTKTGRSKYTYICCLTSWYW